MAEYDLVKMQKKLWKYMDEERFLHTIGVMHTCACLAMVHGLDINTAQCAGLLHDSAKCIPNKKKIRMVLRRIKDQFEKTIIIVSNNPNTLLQETEELIIFKNDKILAQENTMDCYQRVDFLKKHKIEVPDIIDFVYLAKKNKKAKIDYAKDIRDLIKDIYKHV